MRTRLKPHPDTPVASTDLVTVNTHRKGREWLGLTFRVFGAIDEIAWPGDGRSGFEDWQRADELWKHSCFEIFAQIKGSPRYLELNFSMARQWAAYGFSDYREGMKPADDVDLVVGRCFYRHERRVDFEAVMHFPPEFHDSVWEVGMSAVIEEKSGEKSYWALKHPEGKPDFHHPDCFVMKLPPPDKT